jgi:transposase
MKGWLVAKQKRSPPSLSFGKAVSYALGQWERIEKYLLHELLTPDTNAIENAIRPFVVGRKNWLFSNTPLGAHASAGIYSLIETAKANGLSPTDICATFSMRFPKQRVLKRSVRYCRTAWCQDHTDFYPTRFILNFSLILS